MAVWVCISPLSGIFAICFKGFILTSKNIRNKHTTYSIKLYSWWVIVATRKWANQLIVPSGKLKLGSNIPQRTLVVYCVLVCCPFPCHLVIAGCLALGMMSSYALVFLQHWNNHYVTWYTLGNSCMMKDYGSLSKWSMCDVLQTWVVNNKKWSQCTRIQERSRQLVSEERWSMDITIDNGINNGIIITNNEIHPCHNNNNQTNEKHFRRKAVWMDGHQWDKSLLTLWASMSLSYQFLFTNYYF